MIRTAPEHGRAHFAGGRTDIAREQLLVLEIDVDRADEILAVEESADSHFDSDHAALKLKDFNFIGEGPLVGFEHSNYVLPVFFLTDEEAAETLGLKLRSMQRMWRDARQWLFEQMESGNAKQSAGR